MTDPSAATPPPTVPGLSGLTVLARGGYATVFRAMQESVSREVAVKVENRTLEGERDRRRFLREARAAGRMSSHPHVVDLFDAGVTQDGHPYLIMELCDGSYAERMRTDPLGAVEARDVGVKIADALADAHALGVCHRDVKPANILITRFGEPALADFGLAILAETRDASITLDVLTPAYAPPELFRHSPPSTAVDVYALCATLFAVMHGRPPRWREDRNPSLLTLLELFAEPLPDLPGVPREFIDVLRAGMANEPAERPNAERLRDMLAAVPLPAGAGGETTAVRAGGGPASGGPPGGAGPASGGPGVRSGRIYGTPVTSPAPPVAPPPEPMASAPQAPPFGFPPASSGAAPSFGTAPSIVPPAAEETPTVPHRWRDRWLFAALVGVLVAVALIVTAGIWYAGAGGDPLTRRSPAPSTRASVSPSRPVPSRPAGGGAAVSCVIAAFTPGARCPERPECFGPVTRTGGVARADRRPCDQVHTWETFALGSLAASTTGVGVEAVSADPSVRALCQQVHLATLLTDDLFAWQVEVLPPTPEQFAGGDRAFRCLGGKGRDQLTGPTLPVGS